jgi:hypothetical protein
LDGSVLLFTNLEEQLESLEERRGEERRGRARLGRHTFTMEAFPCRTATAKVEKLEREETVATCACLPNLCKNGELYLGDEDGNEPRK